MNHISMVPFGARLTVAAAAVQAAVEVCPQGARVSKWAVLRSISDARVRIGVSDRAVAVLHAMLSFVQGDEIRIGEVVFPSNATLSARAHGMAAPTLRRHIAQLVETGLIIRRDSPNGKRYARRGEDGAVAMAFGFDLSPLVARAADFERLALEISRDRRLAKEARERITLLRRDISGTIECLLNEGEDVAIGQPTPVPPRSANLAELEEFAFALGLRKAELDKQLERLVKARKLSGNEAQIERHKQDSNPNIPESELLPEHEQAGNSECIWKARSASEASPDDPKYCEQPRVDLAAVLAACPSLRDWLPQRVRTWDDLVRAAEAIRPALGISPDAWSAAISAMGDSGAAVTLATILQRADVIASPGGYLRSLAAKALTGHFSPGPIVVSLLRQRAKAQMRELV